MNGESNFGGTPPVSVGDVIEEKCISLGKKGDGIFKHENFVVIVPNVKEGETYKIAITKVLSTVAFGEEAGKEETKDE